MGTALPLDDHAQAAAIAWSEAHQRRVHPGEMGRAPVAQRDQDAEHQRAHAQLVFFFFFFFFPGFVEPHGVLRRAPRRVTASASLGLVIPATRSPRRCEQVMPAASMKALRPMASMTATSHVARAKAPGVEPGEIALRRQAVDEGRRHGVPLRAARPPMT